MVNVMMRLEIYERGFTGYAPPHKFYGTARISGYDTDPEKILASCSRPGCTPVGEGCLVLDKRACYDHPQYATQVIRGPLVDPFGPGEVCPEPSIGLRIGAAANSFGTILAMHEATKQTLPVDRPGPLDSVSWDAYCELWKKLGARVGVVRNGQVVWE